jgi:PAS domain S-box-containing protein
MPHPDLDLFGIDSEFPPKTSIPLFREKLATLSRVATPAVEMNATEQFVGHLLDLFGNVLDYIDVLEQDVFDLKVVLSTTVQHSTVIENDLSSQTEQMSNKSQKFEFIVNSSVDWMALVNRGYLYEAANESMAAIFGKTVDQLLGRSVEKTWGTDFFIAHIRGSIDSCFEGHEIQEHLLCQLPRQRERWCEFTYTPYRNAANEITHVACIARDISARRRAENLLREHTLYLDKVNDAIIVIGLDQKVYYWNKSAERIYGWKREHVIDKKRVDTIIPSPEKLEFILNTVKESGEWRGEMVHISKSRKEIAVDSNWMVINSRENEQFIVITNTDITEKKLLEQQFLRIQRMEGIGSVASGIAHDLNNVLSALFMSIRLLKPNCTDDKSVQILDLLDNSAKRGVNLVRQILEFARGIDGNELVIPIPKVLTEIQEFLKSTFPTEISVSCQVPVDLWQVVGNPTQLHQVILNLCVNSKDAMTSGGTLFLAAENVVVREKRRQGTSQGIPNGNYVRLVVRDTGIGIAKSVLAKIFDPFFTTKEKGKGTGLGLSTVHTIVKNHGGFMEVKSRLNRGAEFMIYLPATPQAVVGTGTDEQLNFTAMRLGPWRGA